MWNRKTVQKQFKPETDYEKLGYETMVLTRNLEAAKEICACKLHALADKIQPFISEIESALGEYEVAVAALCSHLYDRDEPVSDARMLALGIAIGVLGVLTVLDAFASITAHVTALYLFGWGIWSVLAGPAFTVLAVVAGYLAFEKLLASNRLLQGIVIVAAAVLAFWGLLQWAQARALIATHAESTPDTTQSYVEGTPDNNAVTDKNPFGGFDEQAARKALGAAWVKLMLSADLVLGILLGEFLRRRTDEDFTAWSEVHAVKKQIARMELQRNSLIAVVEIAKKNCMAGILRALHTPQKRKRPPFFRWLPLAICAAMLGQPAHAQQVGRQEGILIDISGSIGAGGANNDLFREYVDGAKHLIESEPPGSRVVVSVITTDSFGSVRELVKGWTPEQHGVFTEDLDRARRQLAASFVAKSAALTPISAGTDIIGALWRMKTIFESGDGEKSTADREIWIFSDMINETAALPMPALLGTGPDRMLEQAKANGVLVPLNGYRIHVVGVSTRGFTPQEWNAVKTFWQAYFKAAGAELVSYAADVSAERH